MTSLHWYVLHVYLRHQFTCRVYVILFKTLFMMLININTICLFRLTLFFIVVFVALLCLKLFDYTYSTITVFDVLIVIGTLLFCSTCEYSETSKQHDRK